MQTLVLIIAFWLILLGIYGALPIIMAPFRRRERARRAAPASRFESAPPAPRVAPAPPPPIQATAAPPIEIPRVVTVSQPIPVIKSVHLPAQMPMEPVMQAPEPPKSAKSRKQPVVEKEVIVARQAAPATNGNASHTPAAAATGASAVFSEVEMLREQVETLRSEIASLSTREQRDRTARAKRYRTGSYTDLPRHLRRQVREVRNERHPAHA
ncbi:MAG TPA: hypothetical protein VI759_10650 [Dehalococcoidia bacterium]|nr:hypothetical protein [Dehalococcoidia bacterium]